MRGHVYNKIRKLWSEGRGFIRCVVFETNDESIAFTKEKELIALYGRQNLTNMTDGGEGQTGRTSWNKGKSPSPQTRQKIRDALKGKRPPYIEMCWTEEARRKHSETIKGRAMPIEVRQKISATLKRKGIIPPYVGKHMPEDVRKRIGESVHRSWAQRKAAQAIAVQS